MPTLAEKIENSLDLGFELPAVPLHITKNLSPLFELRPYQNEAFSRFLFYLDNKKLRQNPAQLLFHMATGSGKTLIMAGLILHLYTLGYRDFLFFVNNTNIIKKTKDNFLNPLSIKYLFPEKVDIDNTNIKIKTVDNFQCSTDRNAINILFSTIQGLHVRLNAPRENSVTYDDFADRKAVLISDEAHHINVDTKSGKLNVEEETEKISWETTVGRIFHSNSENFLLEFTATIDMTNSLIEEKYRDKLIFDYPLRKFRREKYSKEVNVFQSDTTPFQRALQAVVLSQYRYKVFEKHRLNIKPVVLFKSARIKESRDFRSEFTARIKNLKKSDFNFILKSKERQIKDSLAWFESNNISLDNLIAELKSGFSEEKCIEINSKEESEENQLAINTLEMPDNQYRAIFAVDKLNEGWDVLNLFDIVRLYDSRDADRNTGRPGRTTIAEAQLIGRGARYCPFKTGNEEEKFRRKYDDDPANPLRICEELYYHAAYNPRYISELHNALHEIGMKDKNTKEIQLSLKLDFKETDLYKEGYIFTNKKKKYDHSDIFAFSNEITGKRYKYVLNTGMSDTSRAFDLSVEKNMARSSKEWDIIDFGENIIRKAMSETDFYSYKNLLEYFPNLPSISDFITSSSYLGGIKVDVSGAKSDVNTLSCLQKLQITSDVLGQIENGIKEHDIEYSGSEDFDPHDFKSVFKDKKLNITNSDNTDKEYGVSQKETLNNELRIDLGMKDWYAFIDNFGTSEEKRLVKYIDKVYEKLKTKYKDIYLVRNEGHFKLYSFEGGFTFEPDFVLFLIEKKDDISVYYQVFLEPKGEHLFEHDKWKEDFLLQLRSKHKIRQLWQSKHYVVWGMPFFNDNNPQKYERFDSAFARAL
ncbi:MAG: DEAD/DEAH box helicase family protein [Spirochaetaceae bacterium]|jgi:type III restriction enzyme|nr:DEAD/DEAH box helicase family protein [Spirochaetaceae bacterium]